MNKSFFQQIRKVTGRRQTECACQKCKDQCKMPCLGTPEDILKIIEAGHGRKLTNTIWAVGKLYNKAPLIPMVQPKKMDDGCVFFQNGLCELHDSGLKPTEGKLSNHEIRLDNYLFELSLSWNVAKEWIKPENSQLIIKILFLLGVIELWDSGIGDSE